jgi:iron complex transport system substrate-binding protein
MFFLQMLRSTLIYILLIIASPARSATNATPERIITLSSALTETTDALGLGSKIVATDVTSEYPAYVKGLPKVSQNRSLSIEGIMKFRPDIILAPENDIPRNMLLQLNRIGIKVVTVQQEFSIRGAEKFIREVATALQIQQKGEEIGRLIKNQLSALQQKVDSNKKKQLKVLFIYARGVGNMLVAGKGSNMDAMINLSGARNAVQEFAEFKPYSTEGMIKANPDVILMFDFGASSLGGRSSILKMPGINLTNAGKQQNIIEVDGPLMVNFATRLPDAIKTLHGKLYP